MPILSTGVVILKNASENDKHALSVEVRNRYFGKRVHSGNYICALPWSNQTIFRELLKSRISGCLFCGISNHFGSKRPNHNKGFGVTLGANLSSWSLSNIVKLHAQDESFVRDQSIYRFNIRGQEGSLHIIIRPSVPT